MIAKGWLSAFSYFDNIILQLRHFRMIIFFFFAPTKAPEPYQAR